MGKGQKLICFLWRFPEKFELKLTFSSEISYSINHKQEFFYILTSFALHFCRFPPKTLISVVNRKEPFCSESLYEEKVVKMFGKIRCPNKYIKQNPNNSLFHLNFRQIYLNL